MPLTLASDGNARKIVQIGGKDDTKRHLETLGFVVGETVSVVSEMGGNMIVVVKDTRIAISKSMANRIIVA